MPQQPFGEWLKEKRLNCQLSQDKAGKRIGVSGAAISRWESEIDSPDTSRFGDIEAAYHLPAGSVSAMLQPPAQGASLDYWVGRWEQQTMHFRRILADQEDLLSVMKEQSSLGAVAPSSTPIEIARQTASAELFGTALPSESSRPETGGADPNRPPTPPGSRSGRTGPVTT